MINDIGAYQDIIDAMSDDTYEKIGDLSATGLIAPVRQRFLMDRYGDQIEERASDNLAIFYGKAVHSYLEKYKTEESISEFGFTIEVLGKKIGMRPDLIVPRANEMWWVIDRKVTSVWSVMFSDYKSEWEKQVNIYAYGLRQKGYNVNELTVEAFLKDWSYGDSVKKPDYPKYAFKAVHNIPVWSDAKCINYIEERVKLYALGETQSDFELPHCTEEERWCRDAGFAVEKSGTGRAVSGGKFFATRAEAEQFQRNRKGGSTGTRVRYRAGTSIRCERYCPVKAFCNQYNTEICKDPF